MRKLAAGNWKMNGLSASLAELDALGAAHADPSVDVMICPPATLIGAARARAGKQIVIGAQDCHIATSGAHTGDLSAQMLVDAGADAIIVGHSERRADHHETDAIVKAKAEAAIAAGATAIVCLGETLTQRDAGGTLMIVAAQLDGSLPDGATADNLVIAYEPVWAIGTGKVATPEQIAEVHDALRKDLEDKMPDGGAVRILYGGSVKAGNAAEIFGIANVDGALVGGASLTCEQFSPIVSALEASS